MIKESVSSKVEEIVLEAGKIAQLIMVSDHMIEGADVQVVARHIAEDACVQFISTMGVPVANARYSDVIAEYPETLWDHVKQKLRLKHNMRKVTYTEVICFPDMIATMNEKWRDRARIYQKTFEYTVGPGSE